MKENNKCGLHNKRYLGLDNHIIYYILNIHKLHDVCVCVGQPVYHCCVWQCMLVMFIPITRKHDSYIRKFRKTMCACMHA